MTMTFLGPDGTLSFLVSNNLSPDHFPEQIRDLLKEILLNSFWLNLSLRSKGGVLGNSERLMVLLIKDQREQLDRYCAMWLEGIPIRDRLPRPAPRLYLT